MHIGAIEWPFNVKARRHALMKHGVIGIGTVGIRRIEHRCSGVPIGMAVARRHHRRAIHKTGISARRVAISRHRQKNRL